ncbi:hypothetical protein SAY87_031506 [Trapa incisa]|uniref:QWRF motif-containing protein 2 n=1 Tax=Trapa incisa TaxID=236973 RepID=A0AAN7QL86_9MYRT|nr:hypothetical protein SAY87_031506 [Trapa incisa]
MVVAASMTIKNHAAAAARSNRTRSPLLPSEPDNATAPTRRVRSRDFTSRYMSSTCSSSSSWSAQSLTLRRCPSPAISRPGSSLATMTPRSTALGVVTRSQSTESRRTVTPRTNYVDLRTSSKSGSFAATMKPTAVSPAAMNRSQSAERRRPATSLLKSMDLRDVSSKGGSYEVKPAQKVLLTSVRSLSASFQGASLSLQVSKANPVISRSPSPGTVRRGTPERIKPASTAATPATVEHHRWPGRLRAGNSMSRSVDITDERRRLGGSNMGSAVSALQIGRILDPRSFSSDGKLSNSNLSNVVPRKLAEINSEKNLGLGLNETSGLHSSDGEDSSSQGNSGAVERGGGGVPGGSDRNRQRAPRGIVVPGRFMHESNNRLRQQTEAGSPLSKIGGLKNVVSATKFTGQKKQNLDSPVSYPKGILNTRGQSPIRGALRPASPSILASPAASSPRGMSPTRGRSPLRDTWVDKVECVPSVLNFAVEIRKGKFGENRIVDAHAMRLLHNSLLQWRYANARTDLAFSVQQINAERSLYTTWVSTTRLRESVQNKRLLLQLEKENLKVAGILRGQMIYLEQWASIERDYSNSLAGAAETLTCSTICLPINGARADIQTMKNAICSAVGVMQAMTSSVCLLLSKVGDVNCSIAELTNVVSKESVLLDQCRELLSTCAALQVKEHSLRAHFLQLKYKPTSCAAK